MERHLRRDAGPRTSWWQHRGLGAAPKPVCSAHSVGLRRCTLAPHSLYATPVRRRLLAVLLSTDWRPGGCHARPGATLL